MTRPKRGVGVRWGPQELVFQRGGNVATGFLTQALAAVIMVLLTTTQAEARTKRSQSAKVEFKQQHPCPANDSTKRPCKGYVIDHIVPIACHGADAPSNMQWQTVADAKSQGQVGAQGVQEERRWNHASSCAAVCKQSVKAKNLNIT